MVMQGFFKCPVSVVSIVGWKGETLAPEFEDQIIRLRCPWRRRKAMV